MNIVKVTYKVSEKPGHRVMSSGDAYELLRPLFNPLQEEFYLLPVVGNETIPEKLFVGSLGAANVDPKLVFHKLLTSYPNCGNFVIAHNHPSGNLEPSREDMLLTKSIKELAKLFAYRLLDHIIFTNSGYYSFADKGEI